MNDNLLFVYLRDCFTAGYTLPQFCIDNNIKKPLFVAADENSLAFFWEIHVQFCYDKRMTAKFAFITGSTNHLNFCPHITNIPSIKVENISTENIDDYDKIFVLDVRRLNPPVDKAIYFEELVQKFIFRVYVEIPLLSFIQKHNGVKLFVINHPMLKNNENNTEREKKIMSEFGERMLGNLRRKMDESNGEKVPTPYDFLGYTNQEVYELLEQPEAIVHFDGSTSMQDRHNKIVSIFDGKRLTANQPEHYEHKIYFVGNCVYFG